jgi:nitroreductase
MDVMQAIKLRKSIRGFLDKPVEEEKLRLVLEAARLAPSANNRQEWRFIIVKDKETRSKLAEAAKGQAFVGQAPVVIVCCADDPSQHVMTCGQVCYPIDVAIAIDHMSLKAVEEGLGSCWIGAFYERKVKDILGIPEHVRVVELFPIGYPKDPSLKQKDRLALDKITMYGSWQDK